MKFVSAAVALITLYIRGLPVYSFSVTNEATFEPASKSANVQSNRLKWASGFSGDSCSETCSRLNGTCSVENFKSINSSESFKRMVELSYYLSNEVYPGTMSGLCNYGVNIFTINGAPAYFTSIVFVMSGELFLTSCGYLKPTTDIALDYCEINIEFPPTSRFCPCIVSDPLETVRFQEIDGN
jgi:hypothetical protein